MCIVSIHVANSRSTVPAIFLASIAMQESSCDPNKTGGAGEQGLMQITKVSRTAQILPRPHRLTRFQDKCGDAPDGNCKEPVSLDEFHIVVFA